MEKASWSDFMVLTYDKIREFQYRERENAKLQELPENFFSEIAPYMSGEDEIIKNAILDIISRRQMKIMNMAIAAAKTGSETAPQNIIKEEEPFFNDVLKALKRFREDVFSGKFADKPRQNITKKPSELDQQEKDGFVRITENLPSFIGTDMKTYHLRKGDKVYLPEDLRNLLIKNNVCEKVV